MAFSYSIEKRFIDYANKIRVENHFADTWVVSFILKENLNDNNTVSLNKVDSEGEITVNNYEEIKLIEISLNHCCSLIKENKDIQVLNQEKLGQDGKEWIKLLNCPIWCDPDIENDEAFILPLHK